MKRLLRLARQLNSLRLNWLPPKKSRALLYFVTGREVIEPYFRTGDLQVLDLREHEVNLFIAILCVFDRDLSAENYAIRFISWVKPKLVLTFIDNFPAFYRVKSRFPEVTTMLIQNGYRTDKGDVFGNGKSELEQANNHVDFMFVFGDSIGGLYRRFISGKTIPIGSFKNNQVARSTSRGNGISYISTYGSYQPEGTIVSNTPVDRQISYGEMLRRREQVVLFLARYCDSHKIRFTIIGKDNNPKLELLYYANLLGELRFEHSPRTSVLASYQALDKASVNVFTSSTLGYESLARGQKTAAFLIDANFLGLESLKFGWPKNLPDEGPFWTHQLNENRFAEVLDYLMSVSADDWEQTRSETMSRVIEFDEGNQNFTNTLCEILA